MKIRDSKYRRAKRQDLNRGRCAGILTAAAVEEAVKERRRKGTCSKEEREAEVRKHGYGPQVAVLFLGERRIITQVTENWNLRVHGIEEDVSPFGVKRIRKQRAKKR